MVITKKQTLLFKDMNGNSPMQSLNTTPVFLLAYAPKQNVLVFNLLSTSLMRLGHRLLLTLSTLLSRMRPGTVCWWMGKGASRGRAALENFEVNKLH
jgi:hypothetical protein